jgi:phosphoribosyl-ATP pyrophosphohydrolase
MNFKDLYELIAERKRTLPERSGTTVLLKHGFQKILPKFNEEAFEVGLALEKEGPDEVALEVSQCFYYIICLAVYLDLPLENLDLNFEFEGSFENEHDLAKKCARIAALVCHRPCVETMNQMTPLLFEAIKMKKTTLDKMFSYL